VDINRDLARSLGITVAQIESTLQLAYGSGQISTILAPQNQYMVILEALPQFQLTPSDLSLLYVRSGSGKMVPLSALAQVSETYGPLSINHTGQLPSVTISYNLEPGVALGTAVDEVNATTTGLPAGISVSTGGAVQQFLGSQWDMLILGMVTILVIYIVLGILYESFIHPLTILSALPFAGFGAVATLFIFNVELSLYAIVGIIMLIGLVKKNGIIMIDFALAVQREGKSPRDAMYQACLVRFRPITMTTLAALMAGLPIALGFGAGAESRRPLGLAVVGGLVFSQTLTLYATPVVYLVMERLRQKLGRRPKTALPAILLEEKTSHPD
jgi:HAE1 family hydrophobic/amphiphilic exporter-1